ncbi:peptidylprolyl isomerase [Coprobacter tertius]|uniref:Periplasmic chaperone PpiD n=1 Tax=Coprobacter tertius TaxID=2944915 RepID=A0ABT1MER2_9BACT|nr:SurA N-terminal domain-containing protein [Coprobacter tertius]MCP9611112.1 SurA N-terminal domain-containing protein [Coprobacter tertius]
MATLEKIRGKAGLLVTVIGVALLAFIVGDLLNSGHTFFRMNQDKVAVVNGKRITVEEFQNRVNQRTEEMQNMYKRYGMSLPEGAAASINKEVFDQMINELLLQDETAKLGITVSKQELADLLQGDNIVPEVKQLFTDPNTGVFDKQFLLSFLNMILNGTNANMSEEEARQLEQQRQMWINLEKNVKQQRLVQKFYTLMSKSVVPNKLDIEAAYEDGKTSADFIYAMQPYSSIADSTVKISDSELKELYNKEKENFKREEQRVVKYFTVDIVPSKADFKATEDRINSLKANFASTKDVAGMLSFNTDVPYVDAYVSERSMDADMKNFVTKAQINDVEGPIFDNNSYKMYRLMGRTVGPDSVKVRHIMFPLQNDPQITARYDSVYKVAKNGGDFAALARQFSGDRNSASNGGDMGWMTEVSASQLGQKFVSAIFSAAKGSVFTVESPYGKHIVEVTERTANVPKAKVAQLVLTVRPSSETYSNLYNGISQYIATNNKVDSFEKNASEKGYNISTADLTRDDIGLGSVRDARKVIKWAFNAKKGDISEIFNTENKFLVGVLANIVKEGYASPKDVENQLKMQLMADKKADIIMNALKEKGASSIDSYAQAMSSKVDTAKFVSFNTNAITGIGFEPILTATAPYAPENKVDGPLKGNNGVYVISVYNKTTNPQPMNNDAEKQKYIQLVNSAMSNQLIEVMKNKADIEDNRIKFF